MKYIFLWTLVFLTGCFGLFDSDNPTNTGLVLSDTEKFSILIPDSWEVLSWDELPVPNSWTTALALKSQNEVAWYYNNLIILETGKTWATTSRALMSSTKSTLEKNLSNFNLISESDFSFLDEEIGTILTFAGKYNIGTPNLYYVQTAKMCGDTSYFLTISIGSAQESYERYEYVLKSFQCN